MYAYILSFTKFKKRQWKSLHLFTAKLLKSIHIIRTEQGLSKI